ncbi:MAG: HlyD family efflux transporter periplasmic adaptor subunit [Alphaproteobacteria bacterium]|nr:HlyD family efflux transporter periplasmic adaptor subunit [Alphaproteobacteria bacterium]
MVRRILILLLLLGAAAAATWALWPKPPEVETARIDRRAIAVTIDEEGKSRIREIFTVSAPIAGQLLRLNLHAGDQVTEGTSVVASIRPVEPDLLDARSRKVAEAAIEAARAGVDLANAQLQQAEAQLTFLEGELGRATKLVAQGTISERAYEKATLDVAVARAEAESARANLMVRRRELERAQAALIEGGSSAQSCCVEVMAPASGEILRVLTESEQVVQAGTALVEIGDSADLEIVAELLSRDAVRISAGAAASVEGWGGKPIEARVSRIDPAAITKVSALGIEEQRVPVVLKLLGEADDRRRLGHDFRVLVRIVAWHGDNLRAVPLALFSARAMAGRCSPSRPAGRGCARSRSASTTPTSPRCSMASTRAIR